jgi:uncharacterized membrane protein YoaK (UPF0700 family)
MRLLGSAEVPKGEPDPDVSRRSDFAPRGDSARRSSGIVRIKADSAPPDSVPAPRLPTIVPQALPSSGSHDDGLRLGLLSGIAGYVDAAGFVTVLGMFPAHLTGELVGVAVSVSSGHPDGHFSRLAMIPIFVVSVAIGAVVARLFGRRGRTPLGPLLGLMTLALALFSATGFLSPSVVHGSPSFGLLVCEGSAIAAMGFQNTFMRKALSSSCPTTVMTGNLTQFIIELVDLIVARARSEQEPGERKQADARLKRAGTALGGFSFGALLGGWLTGVFGPFSVTLPALITAVLTGFAWRERAPSSPPKSR